MSEQNVRKSRLPLILLVGAGLGIGWVLLGPSEGVVDKYAEEIPVEAPQTRVLSEQIAMDGVMLANLLHEVDAIEADMKEMNAAFLVSENKNTGLYTVEQEEYIAAAYSHYLTLRKALFHIAFRHKDYAEITDQQDQDEAFLLAYSSGLSLYRNAVLFVVLFKDQPNARRKLNEGNPVLDIPAGMFDEMYTNITNSENVDLMIGGVSEFAERRAQLEGSALLTTPGLDGLMARLDSHEAELAEAYTVLSEGRQDVLWARVKTNTAEPAYQAQSFISLGSADDLRALGDNPALEPLLDAYKGTDKDGQPFAAIEAIGEGVRMSSLEFALHADELAVVRSKLTPEQIQTAAIRAIELKGTPYDFSFDLSSQDKIICTEMVYRAYAPHFDIAFEEVMGRKTLKPDGMLRAMSPESADGLTEMVLYANSIDGALQTHSVEELMATVP